jgi:hypothetical protein
MTTRLDSPAYLASRFASGIAIGVRLWALIPIPLGIAMFFITSSYTTELVRSALGWLLLALEIAFSAAGYAVNEFAVRLSRKGKLPVGAALIAVSTAFLTFPALWIVFLGPALVVLFQHPS